MRICEKSSNFVVNFIRLIKKEVQMRKMIMILAPSPIKPKPTPTPIYENVH